MNQYDIFECVICHKTITDEYSNNAEPVAKGECCQECNDSVVVSARLLEYYRK